MKFLVTLAILIVSFSSVNTVAQTNSDLIGTWKCTKVSQPGGNITQANLDQMYIPTTFIFSKGDNVEEYLEGNRSYNYIKGTYSVSGDSLYFPSSTSFMNYNGNASTMKCMFEYKESSINLCLLTYYIQEFEDNTLVMKFKGRPDSEISNDIYFTFERSK